MLFAVAALIALIHTYTFFLESLAWGKPRTNKLFGVSKADAETNRLFAFNQGFYNLFLAIALVVGILLSVSGDEVRGLTLLDYGVASVFGAGAVLFLSQRRLWRPALIQSAPAALYFLIRALMP